MAEKLKAEVRDDFGKGASRRLRRENKVPVVVYGQDEDPQHLALDYHTTFLAVRGNANALLELDIDGDTQIALVKDIQRNPLSRLIEHIDLLRVKRGQKVAVDVPVVVEGEPAEEAIATVELLTIPVEAPVTEIPENFVLNVEGREEGDNLTIADIEFPADVETELEDETVVVVIAIPTVEIPEPEEGEEGEGEEGEEGEAAEGEESEGGESEGEESSDDE